MGLLGVVAGFDSVKSGLYSVLLGHNMYLLDDYIDFLLFFAVLRHRY